MLKTDYKNDSLDVSMGGKRRYEMTENADGTVTLTDKTTYSEVGDNFGATEINAITTEVNTVSNNLQTFIKYPDYSNCTDSTQVNITTGNTSGDITTIPYDCYIKIVCFNTSTYNTNIYINGCDVVSTSEVNKAMSYAICPVKKNDIVTYIKNTNATCYVKYSFIPFKE